jgi:RNase H-fold protein (predicted Holliday junction resolvase)
VWGGSRDVAKNEGENGLRQMKNLLIKQNHTDLVVINVPSNHDLQERSCVNSAVKNFNRKLMKYNKGF